MAEATICIEDSASEVDFTSVTAAWVTSLTTSGSFPIMHSNRPSVTAFPLMANFVCTNRSTTEHMVSLAAWERPGKSEIFTNVPTSVSGADVLSSGLMSCVSCKQAQASAGVCILVGFLMVSCADVLCPTVVLVELGLSPPSSCTLLLLSVLGFVL